MWVGGGEGGRRGEDEGEMQKGDGERNGKSERRQGRKGRGGEVCTHVCLCGGVVGGLGLGGWGEEAE